MPQKRLNQKKKKSLKRLYTVVIDEEIFPPIEPKKKNSFIQK